MKWHQQHTYLSKQREGALLRAPGGALSAAAAVQGEAQEQDRRPAGARWRRVGCFIDRNKHP
jgi:hypothetical protein